METKQPLAESGLMTAIRKLWRALQKNETFGTAANRFRAWVKGVWKWHWTVTKPWCDRKKEQQRRKKLRAGQPARVVFLCENPAFWKSFESVVTAMQKDPRIDVVLINLRYREMIEGGQCVYHASDYSDVERALGRKCSNPTMRRRGAGLT